ncbi:poly(A)-specific ribonuclease PARN-like isoform X2 [Cannabis sativa]|uniref:poly(A)-specific ribonuclease PARN-like isoform X2 n=1 Tax=Cannabis sativa TaxID=3483 RepID=UPI0029CA6273|nr:poly(A)-specific ribonuclease PARN-like isoform X2 [Cannabis sativa]
MAPLLQKRFFCSEVPKKWAVKQVTKSNFAESMEEIKHDISTSDFVAVSLQKTGSFSAPWHRAHPFDTAETSYYKAKYAAERFQIFQFAVCPFSVNASKLVAHPYNYLLFPRDELKLGMPSYSFSCQTSYLTSMAREGFDFNACIYDGISYLSRAQEDKAKIRIGNPRPSPLILDSTSTPSVADALFIERVKSRVIQWKKTCKKTKENTHDALMNSLRKLILGSEFYGSRPCITIDVCTERQVKLALEMLRDFADELVPVLIPGRSGGTQAVRVVLTSSQEDKDLFESELQRLEEEENKKVRGFREVIDLISASQKPVVSYNSLNDLTFIHSKFIAPLPPTVDEFASSLSKIFPCVLDVSHLMTFIGPLRKVTNIPVAISLLNSHFFAPVDIEILYKADNEGKIHGHNAVRISHLFAKLCSILKIDPNSNTSDSQVLSAPALTESTNIFNALSTSFEESIDEEISVWTKSKRKVNCEQLVYLWGFGSENTAGKLKTMLHNSHSIFSEEFDIRLVDKSCAVIVFWQPGLAEKFLDVMNNIEKISGSLREMVSEGLRAASYETYKRACKLDIWEANLGESLDRALEDSEYLIEATPESTPIEISCSSDSVINYNDL